MPRDMHNIPFALNESPSEKEGKSLKDLEAMGFITPLNESPSEKEGKLGSRVKVFQHVGPQ